MRVLVIEDDPKIADVIARQLRGGGYAVDVARDGLRGEELASVNSNDVIILDIMLPGQDGLVTCAHLRESGVLTPILMLTALDGVDDRVAGLDAGADDYLGKPFHGAELLARVRSLARRRTEQRTSAIEKFGVRLDQSQHKAWRDGREIKLSAKEFALLELLMMNAGRVLSRTQISEHLWDMTFDPRSNVIESFVKFLRQKIDRQFPVPLIHTVRGVGYRFADTP